MNEKYIDELPTAQPIRIIQFQKLFSPDIKVYIKPCSHKTYWEGQALYIPKELYQFEVRDIAFGSNEISLYVEKNDKYEKIADRDELYEINMYYDCDAGKAYLEYIEGIGTKNE